MRSAGWQTDTLPALPTGVVDIEHLPNLLRHDTRLVCLMLANNETGVLQPVERAAQICAEHGVPLHVDAAQAAGRVPVDFGRLGAATMTICGHKFHGPVGIGGLVVRRDIVLAPLLHGGFQEGGTRPGTEPVALAAGICAALEHWHRDHQANLARQSEMRDHFERALRAGWPDLVVNGAAAPRLPQTSNVAFPGLDRQALVMALDLAGVACSTGSACASGSSEPSATLVAMGLPEAVFGSSLRFSLGLMTPPTRCSRRPRASSRFATICGPENWGKKSPETIAEKGQFW